jgi:sugar-specific transcriptional regulator TrmB
LMLSCRIENFNVQELRSNKIQNESCKKLSLERVLRILESLGLPGTDAEVYIYLAKTGPTKGSDLAVGLGMVKQHLYTILRRLEEKDVVTRSPDHPALFAALAFEALLDRYVKLNVEEAQIIKDTKKELLSDLRDRTDRDNTYPRRL